MAYNKQSQQMNSNLRGQGCRAALTTHGKHPCKQQNMDTQTDIVLVKEDLGKNLYRSKKYYTLVIEQDVLADSKDDADKKFSDNIYQTQNNDAPRNKEAKWDMIFNENRFLKCKSNNETKKLETFKVCRWDCTLKNDFVFDDPIYISRVEMLLNNGKKKKHLYFQSDYNIKTTDTDSGGDDGEGG